MLCQAGDGAALPPVAAATGAMLAPELGGQGGSVRIWSFTHFLSEYTQEGSRRCSYVFFVFRSDGKGSWWS